MSSWPSSQRLTLIQATSSTLTYCSWLLSPNVSKWISRAKGKVENYGWLSSSNKLSRLQFFTWCGCNRIVPQPYTYFNTWSLPQGQHLGKTDHRTSSRWLNLVDCWLRNSTMPPLSVLICLSFAFLTASRFSDPVTRLRETEGTASHPKDLKNLCAKQKSRWSLQCCSVVLSLDATY